MKFTPQTIPDVILIEPTTHGDQRGYLVETFHRQRFEDAIGYSVNFYQDNESMSDKGVFRGLATMCRVRRHSHLGGISPEAFERAAA